eukprot:c16364_g1_i1 orf=168-1181(+)
MERYKRVNSSRTTGPSSIKENEIRITTQGLPGSYISYAISLFQDNMATEVVLTAMGRAINKAVTLAEILKKRIEGLHQNITLSSSDVKDVWEPLEEGLETLEMVRHVSMISITLSTKELDVSSCGYQPPISLKQPQPLTDLNREGGSRGAGRASGRGKGFDRRNMRSGNGYFNDGDENWNPGKGEYRGRGRGYEVGGRGYNRGYPPQADTRIFNRGFVNRFPQTDTRGYNRGYSQADSRVYGNAYHQADNRGQNNYHLQAGTRRFNGGNPQSNMRGYNQSQADARGFNRPQRGSQQYNSGHPQSFAGKYDGDQSMAFWGRGRGAVGGSGRGRGRSRF